MGKASKYSGPLATPIDLSKLPLEGDLHELVLEEIKKKFVALIDHYQIDRALPDEEIFFQLAHCLASDHVPGLRISNPPKQGAPPKWTLDEYRALVDMVNAHKTGKSLKAAMNEAMKQPGWRWGRNIRSIEARYHEALRFIQLSEFLRDHSPEEAFETLMDWYGPAGQAPTK